MIPRAIDHNEPAAGPPDLVLNLSKPDGQASIEHQIDIHVLDLADIRDKIAEVLHGLEYCMKFRIKGGKLPQLNADLMDRLMSALLPLCGQKTVNILAHRPTPEADLALDLFGQFLSEVATFRTAVARRSAVDLREGLKLHRRCQPWSSPAQRESAATVLSLILNSYPRTLNWKELIKADEHDDVAQLMQEFAPKFSSTSPPQPVPSTAAEQPKLFPPPALYFDRTPERVAEMFEIDLVMGLSAANVASAAQHYGTNTLPAPKKTSILAMIVGQLSDFMIIILILAAIIEGFIGEIRNSFVLLSVVVINVVIGFHQERKATAALKALTTLSVPQASVYRDGDLQIMEASQLVPGDIVSVEEGDAIPADLRLFDVSQLELIESILTGESMPTTKSIEPILKRTRKLPLADCKGTAFMATVVAKGRGKGIVVRTGINTEIGKISEAITSTPIEPTNIQKKLAKLGQILVALSIGLCGLIVAIGIAYGNDVREVIQVGISLAVSVIPEGLVAVVTVTMAVGVRRMAARNAIVRQLASVETLGSVSVICSDKTGTLTEGKMGCSEIWTSDDAQFRFTHSTSPDPSQGKVQSRVDVAAGDDVCAFADVVEPPTALIASAMVCSLCSNAQVKRDESSPAEWISIGDPTEVAMVIAGQKARLGASFFTTQMGLERTGEFAFDSDRKLMSVIYEQVHEPIDAANALAPNTAVVLVKGAPEGILSRCVESISPSPTQTLSAALSSSIPLTDDIIDRVSQRSAAMADQGLRVLALAMKSVSVDSARQIAGDVSTPSGAESQLTFIGLVGLIDPARAGVRESVASCHRAGIRVVMITGDHIATATAIAKQLGILDPADRDRNRSMAGYEVDSLSADKLAELNPFPVVFARVSPDNKLKIVESLQTRSFSVAMTGDGVNDAPAIKRANVGIAMGIGGTEITKQAADIVLADDNFSTIVEAVREGRRVFDNIAKFAVYLLSCNSAEIFLFLATSLVNVPTPFSTIQILWANIIADVPPAMSLGVEPFERDLMERKPRPQHEGVLTTLTSTIILLQGCWMSATTFLVYILARRDYLHGYESIRPGEHSDKSLSRQQALAFLVLTTMQILQCFLSRSLTNSVFYTGVTANPAMIWACLLSFVALLAGIYMPGVYHWLEFQPVDWFGWTIILGALVSQLVVVELIKLVVRCLHRRRSAVRTSAR